MDLRLLAGALAVAAAAQFLILDLLDERVVGAEGFPGFIREAEFFPDVFLS
jgi:hypothetical protein